MTNNRAYRQRLFVNALAAVAAIVLCTACFSSVAAQQGKLRVLQTRTDGRDYLTA